jgi:hypothetical protein
MIEGYPKSILRILQTVCSEGMTRNRLKSQRTGVYNVDLFEMFLLGFENMNCSFGSQELPGSAGGLGSVIIILPSLACKTNNASVETE